MTVTLKVFSGQVPLGVCHAPGVRHVLGLYQAPGVHHAPSMCYALGLRFFLVRSVYSAGKMHVALNG
jgi:hypothetical protein